MEMNLSFNQQSQLPQSPQSQLQSQQLSEQQLHLESVSFTAKQQHQHKHRSKSPHIISVPELIDGANSIFLAVMP